MIQMSRSGLPNPGLLIKFSMHEKGGKVFIWRRVCTFLPYDIRIWTVSRRTTSNFQILKSQFYVCTGYPIPSLTIHFFIILNCKLSHAMVQLLLKVVIVIPVTLMTAAYTMYFDNLIYMLFCTMVSILIVYSGMKSLCLSIMDNMLWLDIKISLPLVKFTLPGIQSSWDWAWLCSESPLAAIKDIQSSGSWAFMFNIDISLFAKYFIFLPTVQF